MHNILFKTSSYCISQMDVSELRELATFVVSQNYMHHLEGLFSGDLSAEIEDIYQE